MSNDNKNKVYYKTFALPERICSACGTKLPEQAMFCGGCGAKYEEKKPKRLPYCLFCGEMLHEAANYCILCGIRYTEDPSGFVEIPRGVLCKNCGANIIEGEAFCMKCGASIDKAVVAAEEIKYTIPCCPDCGTPIQEVCNFCSKCGRKFKIQMDAADYKSVTAVIPVVENNSFTCPACGTAKQKMNRKCCFYCGREFIVSKEELPE